MAKGTTVRFVCTNCGYISQRWSGKCPQCGEWNTLEETISQSNIRSALSKGNTLPTYSVSESAATDKSRLHTGINELDKVFGGGIVSGSINLLAGQPGIGKSTLLLQLAFSIAKDNDVLYVSGEESIHQIGMRAKRLGVSRPRLQLATSSSAEDISSSIVSGSFQLVIIDSIQTVSCADVSSAAGSVAQIMNSTRLMTSAAKANDTSLILVGHVTKEGSIAGPKVLEHLVDVVLQLEGDQFGGFKMLRPTKNRFGSINEVGIFEMTDRGLQVVENPSKALLAERQISDGSIVLATLEGSRPILVEVQALVNTTTYGYPKRTASGFDLNRLNLLIAMLERRTKLKLSDKDIFINIVGGIQIKEPGADLAICLAIGSAAKAMQLKENFVVFGEIGLSGEIRHVPQIDKRLTEAKKLGFKGSIGPQLPSGKKDPVLHVVKDVKSALNQFLSIK